MATTVNGFRVNKNGKPILSEVGQISKTEYLGFSFKEDGIYYFFQYKKDGKFIYNH